MAIALSLLLVSSLFICGQSKKVLVIGGDDILGSELVSLLVRQENTDVSVLDFYTWVYDESKHRSNALASFSFSVVTCRELTDLLVEKERFDIVYDTSTLKPNYLKDILALVRQHVDRYVFVSTTAVYQLNASPAHVGGFREEDAIRPTTEVTIEDYNYQADYKLHCEEILEQEHKDHKLNYISVRLPDVIGPRDNTDRFWFYFLMVKFQDILDQPLNFPPRLHNQKLSMVHSEDVAYMLLALIDFRDDVFNQAYNLAFQETVTLKEFLTILGEHVGNSNLVFDESTVDGAVYYPSVKRGPVNITKAQRMLNWRPVSLSEGVKKTAQFYSSPIIDTAYQVQFDNIINNYFSSSKADALRKKCADLYGTVFDLKSHHGDEL